MTSDFEGFFIPDFIHYIASIFPFECSVLNQGTTGFHFYNVFGMTRSLTGDWTRDFPHSKPALYHYAIEKAVEFFGFKSVFHKALNLF